MRYFVAVAEEGHFGRAARRLNIVQPALSMQIKALEDELGGPLFVRSSRRVDLNEAGRLFLAEASRILEQTEQACLGVRRLIRGEIGTVRVGFAANAVFCGRLMDDVRRFQQNYPDAQLFMNEMAPSAQIEALQAGELDVAYAPCDPLALPQELAGEPFGGWPLVLALPADHHAAAAGRVDLKQLGDVPLILPALHDDRVIEALRARLAPFPSRVCHATSTLGMLAMVASGQGVALVPAPVAQIHIPGLCYQPLPDPAVSVELHRLYRVNESSGAVHAFLA